VAGEPRPFFARQLDIAGQVAKSIPKGWWPAHLREGVPYGAP